MNKQSYKLCKQCGEARLADQYRQYYQGRKGRSTTCLDCEKVNSRYKYLNAKESLSPEEFEESTSIVKLWELQRKLGLRPPRIGEGRHNNNNKGGVSTSSQQILATQLDKFQLLAQAQEPYNVNLLPVPASSAAVPEELQTYLDMPITELALDPSYYLDEVYEDLKAKYRPILGVDVSTNLPVYSPQYKQELDQILAKFYEYEDNYSQ